MKILFKSPNNDFLEPMEINNTAIDIHKLIDGYFQCIAISPDIMCLCDEDGIAKDLPYNYHNDRYGTILGNVIFCGVSEYDFASISDEQIVFVSNYLKCPIKLN